ncbi:MAG: helix-turn-helix transcriptional regulator [Thermodesulfobacteriota bacterium]
MDKKTLYDEFMEDREFARLMHQEELIMDVTEGFCRVLEEESISRSKLAQLMGKTKGYISQLLGGKRNISLRVLADIAGSLGYSARVVFRKKSETNRRTMQIVWPLRKPGIEYLVKQPEPVKDCANIGH